MVVFANGGVAYGTIQVRFPRHVGEAARQLGAAEALLPRGGVRCVGAAVLEARLFGVIVAVAERFERLVAILLGPRRGAQVGQPVVGRVAVDVVDGAVAAHTRVVGVEEDIVELLLLAADGDLGVYKAYSLWGTRLVTLDPGIWILAHLGP